MSPHPRYYQLLLLAAITLTATSLPSPQLTTGNVNKLQGKGQKLADSYSHLGVGTHLEGSCGFVGNPDVYGLGIRIGIYTQWLSTMLSNWLISNKVSRMRDINTCFQVAMLFAIFSMSGQEPAPHAIDLYIIMVQIVGSLCTVSSHNLKKASPQPPATANKPDSSTTTSWGSVLRFLIYWTISAYSTFFWFHGFRAMRPLEPGCTAKAWIFAKVSFEGWFRIFMRVLSTAALVLYTILSAYLINRMWRNMIRDSVVGEWRRKRRRKAEAAREREREKVRERESVKQREKEEKEMAGKTNLNTTTTNIANNLKSPSTISAAATKLPLTYALSTAQNQTRDAITTLTTLTTTYKHNLQSHEAAATETMEALTNPRNEIPLLNAYTPLFCISLFACSIAAIECMIQWNGIVGVKEVMSTGQMIPLVTGAGGLLRVWYVMWREPESWWFWVEGLGAWWSGVVMSGSREMRLEDEGGGKGGMGKMGG